MDAPKDNNIYSFHDIFYFMLFLIRVSSFDNCPMNLHFGYYYIDPNLNLKIFHFISETSHKIND